jgi:hypothetical protein
MLYQSIFLYHILLQGRRRLLKKSRLWECCVFLFAANFFFWTLT